MKVTVKLIGPLIYSAGFSEKEMELPVAATAGELISRINFDKSRPTVVLLNGKSVKLSDSLKDGDRVAVAPIYSGG